MDSSDYVYGTIFVLYVALFLVIGGYICSRRKRKNLTEGGSEKTTSSTDEPTPEAESKDLRRSKKKD